MFCSSCGNQLESAARFCPMCGTERSASSIPPVTNPFMGGFHGNGQLVRPRSPRLIAGVCAGFAEHYGWDLNLVRLAAVVVTLLTGVTVIAYVVAWIIIPEGQFALPSAVSAPPPPMASRTESAAS
jgi:phage shock protein C